MNTQELAEMFDSKRRFVFKLEDLLREDSRSDVDSLAYRMEFHDKSWYDEYIDVIFTSGKTKRIITTANSNAANLKAVIKEVYEN